MKKIMIKIGAGAAALSLLAFAATPVLADNSITGNGAGSNSSITTKTNCSVSTSQHNTTSVTTVVDQSGTTGGNNSSFNTNEGNSITTGDVSNSAEVVVSSGDNTALVGNPCCACQNLTDNTIGGNGALSHNRIKVHSSTHISLTQKNKLTVTTVIDQKGKTGNNTNSFNTGPGNNSTDTGSVDNSVGVDVSGGSNSSGGVI